MTLNQRKIKILEAIINDYIETAEPIGSRTIAKKHNMGISSATIRNEMSDLEDMGFIIQPHASAGRVPSDKGYRLYVDQLMGYRDLTKKEALFLRRLVSENIRQIDYLMEETAKAIALLTNYTTVVTESRPLETKIKYIQLLPMDEKSVILVIVSDNKTVKNQVIDMDKVPDAEALGKLTQLINNCLKDLTLSGFNKDSLKGLINKSPVDESVLAPILNSIAGIVGMEGHIQIYTSGVKNILSYPEFSDLDKARGIFQALEEKELLITVLNQNIDEETPQGLSDSENIQVIIGAENRLEQMKDCSVIKTKYRMGGRNYGSIGIIGPTRMDYKQTVSVLNGIIKTIHNVLKALSGG